MKSRTLKILPMIIGLVLIMISVSWARDPISHRQKKQSKRITHGIRGGEVTGREFVRLNREQRRIGKYKRRARRDGYISYKERRRLHRMQDRASEHIYQTKHNRASHYACRPRHKHLHFRHRPVYHSHYVSGIFFEPLWSFGWSMGWR
jgi:hypothetical protein